MKKLFNYRGLLSFCLFLMAGIVFVVNVYVGSVFSIIVDVLLAIAFVITIILRCVKKSFKRMTVVITAFVLGCLLPILNIEIYNAASPKVSGEYYITGRVSDHSYDLDDERLVVILDDATIVNYSTLMKQKVSGKIRLYLTTDTGESLNYELGERVEASAVLKNISLFYKGRVNFSSFVKGIYIQGYGTETDINSLNKFDKGLTDLFKSRVREALDKSLDPVYANLGYTMLFGDRAILSDEIESNYFASGIGHLLAVSGLHVGFVVLLLNLILNLFKANGKVRFVVIGLSVFGYAFLCGFSVSVTRALVMTLVLLYAKMRYAEYDGLSSLSLAAVIILLISPLQLFTLGFQLSFGAVAAIMLLEKPIESFFSKFLHKKLASGIALSLSATIGILPFMASALYRISIFSIVTNVIVVPIASVAFMILFVAMLLSIISPVMGVIAYPFEWIMRAVTGISQLTGAVSFASASQVLIQLFSVCVVAVAVTASDHIFLGKKGKIITCCCLGLAGVLFFGLSFI